jgi:dienelactone hydrolase
LRAAGHNVSSPDLYNGDVFDDAAGAIAKIQELGFDEILVRSRRTVADLAHEMAYIGFSNGGACAELVAATRPGARGVVLIGAPLSIRDLGWTAWPPGVPVHVHFGEEDPRRNEHVIHNLLRAFANPGQYLRNTSTRLRCIISRTPLGPDMTRQQPR